MKHLAFALSVGAVILTAQAASAQPTTLTVAGAPLDHLVCYKTLDKLKLPQPNSTDLLAQLQPEFTQKGCTLLKAVEFCVPATKINVSPVPPDPNIFGTPLQNDYICYLAKCPNQVPPPDKKVIDQFGQRVQENYHLTKVCVPARKAPAGCPDGATIVNGAPKCAGACRNNTDLCKTVAVGGVKTCKCIPKNQPCGGQPDAAGHCGGICPTDQDCVLTQVITNPNAATPKVAVKCDCRQPPDPICSRDAVTAACGGKCPKDTEKCVVNRLTGQCDCETPNLPCQATADASGAVMCNGECPVGQTCDHDQTTGKCSCSPPAQCAQDLNGTCGGPCPPGQVCVLDSTGKCGCKDTPCGSNNTTVPPSCGGACPLSSQHCDQDTTGACNCLPNDLPCQSDGAGACGGNCPAPQVCRNIPGTANCQCQ